MHLLTLPDELFLSEIFPYLHPTDLLRVFCTLDNYRLVSLVYAYMRHLDWPHGWHCLDVLRPYQWHQICSLRITAELLSKETSSIFPRLERLDVTMARSMSPSLLSLFTRVKRLNVAFTESERIAVDDRVAGSIWHADSRLQSLSISHCIIMDESCFLAASSSLVTNRSLTRLALVAANLESTIPLLSLTPALRHLRIRLCRGASWSTSVKNLLESPRWSPRIQSLHLTVHGRLLYAHGLCEYIRLFAASLQHLSFYVHLIDSYLMKGRRCLEQCLLNDLPKLKQLSFCAYSGLGMRDSDYRRTFDGWVGQHHVISIFDLWPGMHTRFTLPFAFDRLERVTNSWLDYHSNETRPDFVLSLPSVTSISFLANEPLKVELVRLIRRACPRLQRMDFLKFCHLDDNLIQETELTLPSVAQLRVCDLFSSHRQDNFHCLFRLLPNLAHLTVDATELPELLDAVACPQVKSTNVRELVIVEDAHRPAANRLLVAQRFPNASVLYRTRTW